MAKLMVYKGIMFCVIAGFWAGGVQCFAVDTIAQKEQKSSSAAVYDLYPRNHSNELDMELFRLPAAEYRGTPFWSWNNKLDLQQLLRQLDCFKEMGFGGVTIHCRTGLDTEYMGPEFMQIVKVCTAKAKQLEMLTWLYDEDRWPSGFAGGLVTKDEQYRAKQLRFTTKPNDNSFDKSTLLARYEVKLKNGYLDSYRLLKKDETAAHSGKVWYAYLEPEASKTDPWFNNQTYVDVLSKKAIERFLEVTHERYFSVIGNEFGKSVPAIFTDEPRYRRIEYLKQPDEIRDICIPFTTDYLETYQEAYKQKLINHLPELFWELPEGKASLTRYRYYDHLCEQFAAVFGDTIGRWCDSHNIALTGHSLAEETLGSQTNRAGECMRFYRSFGIPGIDMLCDRYEYNTAKQAQSAAHQYGRGGVLSELYGVTGWHFDFIGHKAQGDWQAALGVTVRVPHLSWVSMAGEAKRDYPASIFYQSPWYREYKIIEDYFGRINTVMTRGTPSVRIGVIHPVESYWLSCGPLDQTEKERNKREENYANLTEWLLFSLMDFDFICESTLPVQCPKQKGDLLKVGQMAYDTVIVPDLRTIRSTTLDRLEAFAKAGGEVIFAGAIPSLVDAQPSERAKRLAKRCTKVDFDSSQIIKALEPYRQIDAHFSDGKRIESLLYQIRSDGARRNIFICNIDREHPLDDTSIRIRGDWSVTLLDTFEGTSRPLAAKQEDDFTVVTWSFPAHGSLLLTLSPGFKMVKESPAIQWQDYTRLDSPAAITLSEDNVLMLDQAQWKFNDEPWQEPEEILRIENLIRARVNLGKKSGHIVQPWADRSPAPELAKVSLKFTVDCTVDVNAPLLALENPQQVHLQVDGRDVSITEVGYFTDEAIRTVRLPNLAKGTHEIVLESAYNRKTNLEWCYLLGDFGVEVNGRKARIIAPVRSLAFGDWTQQGLPFYAGNVTYHCTLDGQDKPIAITEEKFKAPLLSVNIDGQPAGKIAFAPYRLELGNLSQGKHKLDITVYGNRANAFGIVHNTNKTLSWYGPAAWRTTGETWSYDYQLRPMGILEAPSVQMPVR